jgi:hypothetical protein
LFKHEWIATRGTVVEVREKDTRSGTHGLTGSVDLGYVIDVEVPEGGVFRTFVNSPHFEGSGFHWPVVGHTVELEMTPDRKKVRLSKSDTTVFGPSGRAENQANAERVKQLLQQAPGSVDPEPPGHSAHNKP